MGKYDDIITLDRPRSAYPKMKISDRAKQFAPFAALTGYDDVIEDRGRVFDRRRYLSEEEKEKIDAVLSSLKKNDMVTVEYFSPESDDDLGFYKEISGKVAAGSAKQGERHFSVPHIYEKGTRKCCYSQRR